MTYISFSFYVLLISTLVFYYVIPLKFRWMILLCGSIIFYAVACPKNWYFMLFSALVSFFVARKLESNKNKTLLVVGIILSMLPWFVIKPLDMIIPRLTGDFSLGFLASVGISFYTMQIIAYLVDVYKGKTLSEKNIAKYLLFILYFPQIIQGPIPRFNDLNNQLYEGHRFDENTFMRGIYNIGWGFFLKLVIADKAAIFVNQVFDNVSAFSGAYYLVAGILYSIELYADFSGCFYICRGISKLFGTNLPDNFHQPYLATSIKDFWGRWHISLSLWLRDYIYIPLGGNRKGNLRKYVNLIITFLVSGIWHGQGFRFIFWGLMHAFYQIVGDLNKKVRVANAYICRVFTFVLVMLAWIVFRANSLRDGVKMILGIIAHPNFSVRPEETGFLLMDTAEWTVLLIAIIVMAIMGYLREKRYDLSKRVMALARPIRWIFYFAIIFGIMTFGTYGYGFNAQAFIYGGF